MFWVFQDKHTLLASELRERESDLVREEFIPRHEGVGRAER